MNRLKKTTLLVLVGIVLCIFQRAQAVTPSPDGCYPNFTTAEGCDALNFLTTGAGNTGLGWRSLFSDTTGSFNTGVGVGTLVLNNADSNTAVGAAALLLNTTGTENTAIGTAALLNNTASEDNTATGAFALSSHTIGNGNTAYGSLALFSDISGQVNTAVGASALYSNIDGEFNTAIGFGTLFSNTSGDNTAIGAGALQDNTTGGGNTALGVSALVNNTTGNDNVALGFFAGNAQTTGSDNIYIGSNLTGTAGESNACYIKSIFGQTSSSGIPVLINANHKLGTTTSSKRFKQDIKPMDKASEALFALKPVRFHYKKEIDPAGTSQLGLVAEDVEKVNSDLVVRDKQGQPYSVRYDQVNAMLLNEFLKEHGKVEKLEATVAALAQTVNEQAEQLRNVSNQLKMSNSIAQVAANNH